MEQTQPGYDGKMRTSIFISLILYSVSTGAQIEFKSFQEVLEFADGRVIGIQSARLGEKISHARKKEVLSLFLPNANASLGYTDNISLQPTLVPARLFNPMAAEDSFEEFTFGTKYLYSRGFQAQWDILNFQNIFAFQIAAKELKKSEINTDVTRYNSYNSLASAYYSIVLTQEAISIYKENAEISQTIYNSAEKKYQEGVVGEADLNMAKINTLQSQWNLEQAKHNLNENYIQLQKQLNTEKRIRIIDAPANFVSDSVSLLNEHPEVRLQKVEVQKYESLLKQKKALRIPAVSLIYQTNKSWATDDFMELDDANDLPQQLFGIQISLSGLNWIAKSQKIKQARLELQLQQQKLESTRLEKEQEDELLKLQLTRASEQLEINKKILSLQEESDKHAENKYRSEIMSLDARLDKYDDLLSAQENYLQSLANFSLVRYKLLIRKIDFQSRSRYKYDK
jgi:outer membrane protein TolC